MLTKRQFALGIAVLAAGFLAMNLLVAFLTRNSVPRRVMRHARENQSASVIALGNSLVAAGFDENAFNAGAALHPPRGSANLGLGASSTVEQLLLFRYSFEHGLHPRLLVYGFYDFQITMPNQFTTADLMGNHAMLYYVEPYYARRFYTLSLHDSLQFRVMQPLPMLADRGAIWAKVEILRRAVAQQGMPAERTNEFGRASDFSLLESANAEEFRRQCEVSMNAPLSSAVAALLRQARQAGVSVVVVEMPMRAAHRHLFYDTAWWQQYTAHLRDLLAPYNVMFIDANDWITDEALFNDPLHLNPAGAAQFSERLGSQLAPVSHTLSARSPFSRSFAQ